MAEGRFPHHHAGKEGAQRERNAEQMGRTVGNADRRGYHGQREQFARPRAGHLPEQPGNDLAPDQHHQADEGADLKEGPGYRHPHRAARHASGCRTAQHAGQRRQQDEDQYGSQILDHQPADRDAPVHAVEHAACFQCLEQHDGTGAGERQAEQQAMPPLPAPERRHPQAEQCRATHLHHRTGHGDALDGEQVAHREVQADTEHQQHHADFGELRGEVHIGDKTGRRRPDQDAGHEIADQGRQLDPFGDEAEYQRRTEAGGKGGDEGDIVFHAAFLLNP